jgi:hypothetical protein
MPFRFTATAFSVGSGKTAAHKKTRVVATQAFNSIVNEKNSHFQKSIR